MNKLQVFNNKEFGQVAKLAMKQGIKIGQKRLFEVSQGVKKKPNGVAFTWTTI